MAPRGLDPPSSSESRSSLVRATCQTGEWLKYEEEAGESEPPIRPPAPAVTTIDLSQQELTLATLQQLPSTLTCVDLSRCGIERVTPLSALRALELLNISYNRLTSLDELRSSNKLKVLYARSNRIATLAGVRGMLALQSLDLECNSLRSIEALEGADVGSAAFTRALHDAQAQINNALAAIA